MGPTLFVSTATSVTMYHIVHRPSPPWCLLPFFFFNATATTEIYTLSLHDALPIFKPPDDYATVVAFDIRPTPLTDFTNDPGRLSAVINLLLRNSPAFRETNLFDALKFVLVDRKSTRLNSSH